MIGGDDAVCFQPSSCAITVSKRGDTGVQCGQPVIPPPISAHDGLRPQGPLGSIRYSGAPRVGPTAIPEPQPTLSPAHAA